MRLPCKSHLSVCLAVGLIAPLPGQAQNMVPQGSFESGSLAGWSETGSATVTTATVHAGLYAARLTAGDLRASFATTAGTVYKASAWIRLVSETLTNSDPSTQWGGFRVAVSDYATWADLAGTGPLLTATHGSDWFKVAITFTATGAQARLQIGYFGGNGRAMVVHVDEVEVSPGSANQPPVIESASLTPGVLGGSPATQAFSVTARDDDGAVRTVAWDFGDGTRATSASGSRRVAVPGSFTARVSVSDDDGAVTRLELPWSLVAPGWPVVQILSPANGTTTSRSMISLSGTAGGATSLSISGDRHLAAAAATVGPDGAWSADVALAPGWNRLLVQVRDVAGRIATATTRVRHEPGEALSVALPIPVPASVQRWEPLELDFAVAGSAATHPQLPYEATPPSGLEWVDGITVDALFSPDNWTTVLRRPAFLRQPYAREQRDGEEWLYPSGQPVWTVRFAPPATGPWRYRIEAREARGTAASAEGTFVVLAPTDPLNHGPVRRAGGDNRYFEHADGTPYLGGGHGFGASHEAFSFAAAETFAEIGAGNQQLLRFWIAGMLWGSAWQPWRSRTLGYEATVPAAALTLESGYAESLAAWRLDAANPILFQGFESGHAALVPGRAYRVRVRWRTAGITGPATAGVPYGVCVKLTGWPEPGSTTSIPVLVPHVAGDTPWHVAEAGFTATGNLLPNLALILENTADGAAWVDEVALYEVAADGSGMLGPQLLRSPRADSVRAFDQRRGAGLDHILAEAAARDIQLRLVISEKQEFLLGHLGPDGLPAPLGDGFFGPEGSASRHLHEYHWRHLFARFGASRAVHSWELVNEAAPGPGAHIELTARLATLAAADGNPHPASISTWASLATAAWNDSASAAIDHADFHCYVRGTGWIEPKAELAADSARFFHEYDLAARGAGFARPVIWGEQGIDGTSGTDGQEPALAADTAGVWLHKLTWARTGPGGVYPIYWYTDNVFGRNLHGRFGAWRRFMEGVPLTNGRYVDAAATASNPALRVIGQKDPGSGRAHLWIDNRNHTWRRVVDGQPTAPASGLVRINLGAPSSAVTATWFNTSTGAAVSVENLTADGAGVVSLDVTDLATDIAVRLAAMSVPPPPASEDDWPQHQRDAARTGRAPKAVAAPYRARWIWLGPDRTLRSRESRTGWPDDLRARPGHTYPGFPSTVSFTIADAVQPVIAGGRVFVGTMEGRAFAIASEDGSTLWSADLPGPVVASAAVAGDRVVLACVTGEIVALHADDGALAWSHACPKAVTSAPCVVGNRVFVGAQDGCVHAIDLASGALAWRSARLGPSIHGGLCSDGTSVFVGTEDMAVHALALSDGGLRASHRVRGQSFRMLWPVFADGRVWVSSVTTPIIGSEYVGERNNGSQLFHDGADLASEEANLLRWLAGDTNGGRWPDAGADWRHLFALSPDDLSEPFVVPAGPADGVGLPAPPPTVSASGRVLSYFKTAFPRLTVAAGGVFGTNFSIDIAAVDPATGRRLPIDNGRLANVWPWETDNLYGMSTAGSQLWLRQNFRGTQVIDLATSTARGVSAAVRNRDGGTFNFDVVYQDTGSPPATPQRPLMGRTAPAIAGGRVYIAENWGITAIEHAP